MLLIDTYSCSQTHEDNMDGNSLKLPCPSATKIGANHTAHSRLPQSARTAPALHITKFSRSSTSLPLPLKRHPHQSCVSLLTHRQKASPLFRHILANEKFGVISTTIATLTCFSARDALAAARKGRARKRVHPASENSGPTLFYSRLA